MLEEKDFVELGSPSRSRLESLPHWAQLYERELRAVVTWWSIKARSKRRMPILKTPASDRLLALPVWFQEWIRTLVFEVYWQRKQSLPPAERPTRTELFRARRNSTTEGSSNARSHTQA